MTAITVRDDVTPALARLASRYPAQAAMALTRLAFDIRDEVRAAIPRRFTFRSQPNPNALAFAQRMVFLDRRDMATAEKLEATVRVADPSRGSNRRRGRILTRHESGETVEPSGQFRAGYRLAQAPEFARTGLARQVYPSSLGFTKRLDPSGRAYRATGRGALGGAARGNRRGRNAKAEALGIWQSPSGAILQRLGPNTIRTLFVPLRQSYRLAPRLGFERTALDVWKARADVQMARAWAKVAGGR